jgi:hypothetical protein
MPLIDDYSHEDVAPFGGPDLLTDDSMVTLDRALFAQNVQYNTGSVGTRFGFKNILTLLDGGNFVAVTELYEWIGPFSQIDSTFSDNAIMVGISQSNNGVSQFSIVNKGLAYQFGGPSVSSSLYGGSGTTAAGASFVGVGLRIFMTAFDSSQKALNNGSCVTLWNNSGAVGIYGAANNLFNGPSTFTPALTEPASGFVTVGEHRLGYLIEFANGLTTRVSPDNINANSVYVFQPISITSAGSKNIRMAFTLNWNFSHAAALEMLAVSVVMTTTTDLNQYYIVPNSRTLLASVGSLAAFNIDVSISDADLSSRGIDATKYLFKFTQNANNAASPDGTHACPVDTIHMGPTIRFRHLCLWGTRMAYLGLQPVNVGSTIQTFVDGLYVSDPNDYQSISSDQHLLELPGQRPISTMFRMGLSNYIVGPHEIWTSSDNNDIPISWPAPKLIDGRHGTLAIHGVEVSPSGDYAWILDQAGLFLFNGSPITSLPISYYQTPDWNRINWGASYCIKVKDNASLKVVHIMVPLDGATSATHTMAFDYTNGATPRGVNYSLNSWKNSPSPFPLSAMELVRNDLPGQSVGNNGKIELWFGSSGTKPLIRQMNGNDFISISGPTAISIAVSAGIAVVTTTTPHLMIPNQFFTLIGATVFPGLNGIYPVTAVFPNSYSSNSTSFQFICPGVPNATYTESTLVITSTPYQEFADGINDLYHTPPLPGRGSSAGQILLHHGCHVRVKGYGTMRSNVFDLDSIREVNSRTITLSTAPDKDELIISRMRNELAYLEVASDHNPQNYFILSYLRWYYSQYMSQR